MESANLTLPESPTEWTAFAGMADREGQEEHKGEKSKWLNDETRHWHHLHRRRVNNTRTLIMKFSAWLGTNGSPSFDMTDTDGRL